jgi:hypothetical protein
MLGPFSDRVKNERGDYLITLRPLASLLGKMKSKGKRIPDRE